MVAKGTVTPAHYSSALGLRATHSVCHVAGGAAREGHGLSERNKIFFPIQITEMTFKIKLENVMHPEPTTERRSFADYFAAGDGSRAEATLRRGHPRSRSC